MDFLVRNLRDFDLAQTIECGQCFHYKKLAENEYKISAFEHLLHIRQDEAGLVFFDTTEAEYEELWKGYFDLERDYGNIKKTLLAQDDVLKPAMEAMWGVRILSQDFFETLISFIISQNQQIPRIKNIVAEISRRFGKKLDEDMYAFPNARAILEAGVEGIRECKAGFRAPYIIDACEKYEAGMLDAKALRKMDYTECIETLKQIKGVGDKVANCVALFSLGHRNAFPVDVWIKRIMEELYFGEETQVAAISQLASEKFGEFGGYAQQYLFYYGKTNEIGKNKK